MKLRQGKFILDIRKRFLTEWVVGHWNRLFRAVVSTKPVKIQGASGRGASSYV